MPPSLLIEHIDPARLRRDVLDLARIVDPAYPGHTRISFSAEDVRARDHMAALMRREAGLAVRRDAAGNIIGRREGCAPGPAVMIGSHLDTVPGGGRFDGIAGVVAGVEVARAAAASRSVLERPLEVVVFTAEEPSPFGRSTIGSRAMAGKLPVADLERLTDAAGRTLGAAIAALGGDPARLNAARRAPGELAAYLELHIEQGPHLFEHAVPVGVVSGIAGIVRGEIRIAGRPDHTGTTPMGRRRDALCAAAEVLLAVERSCTRLCTGRGGLVGTVGSIENRPNALNVVPADVRLGLDLRSLHTDLLDTALAEMTACFDRIAAARRVTVDFQHVLSSPPVAFPESIIDCLTGACDRLAVPHLLLGSGAGHDANHLAGIAPAGMLFIPSKDGRSHCPEEWSEFEDLYQGTRVLAQAAAQLAGEKRP